MKSDLYKLVEKYANEFNDRPIADLKTEPLAMISILKKISENVDHLLKANLFMEMGKLGMFNVEDAKLPEAMKSEITHMICCIMTLAVAFDVDDLDIIEKTAKNYIEKLNKK